VESLQLMIGKEKVGQPTQAGFMNSSRALQRDGAPAAERVNASAILAKATLVA
jgi:hypothetical protein